MDYTLIYILGSVVIGFVIRHFLGGQKWQFSDLRTVVGMLVAEAEQTMPGESGEDKLSWVLGQCDRIGLTKWIPAEILNSMIESTVYWLKNGQPVILEPDPRMPLVVPPPPGMRDSTGLK